MNDLRIREATHDDMGTLLGFEQDLIATERPFDPTLKDNPVKYYDLEKMIDHPGTHLLVAEQDNRIIASAYARIENAHPKFKHERYAYFGFMNVDPQYRGKSINKKMIEVLQQWSISQGLSEMRLDV